VLTELLFARDNEDARKYAAKTLAYLSLRNDKLKAGLLAGKGVQALVEAMQGTTSVETLSHVACTIANLATNSTAMYRAPPTTPLTFRSRSQRTPSSILDESQDLLVQDARLFPALCALAESPADRADILRHVARGLANFALYGACPPPHGAAARAQGPPPADPQRRQTTTSLCWCARHCPSCTSWASRPRSRYVRGTLPLQHHARVPHSLTTCGTHTQTQRHVIRAVDNLLSTRTWAWLPSACVRACGARH
jgi:hypothetical protein